MNQLLNGCQIRLGGEALQQLWRYHNLIRKRNQDRELTRIINFEAVVIKHFVDCLIVDKLTKLPSPLLDVGTGAGFPGIPLKILRPDLKITLAEPRPKRVEFLHEVINELHLKDIDVFPHKVVSRSFQTPVNGVITRAVETIDKTYLRTSACLDQGGRIIFMKGPESEQELKEAFQRLPNKFRVVEDHKYRLPGTEHQRRLIVIEKLEKRSTQALNGDE